MVIEKKTTMTTVAAQAGWYVGTLLLDDNDFYFDPIVAWEITREEGPVRGQPGQRYVIHNVDPITLDGGKLKDDEYVIK